MTKIKYIRVKTKRAVLLISIKEYLKGIDRENEGIPFDFVEEQDYKI